MRSFLKLGFSLPFIFVVSKPPAPLCPLSRRTLQRPLTSPVPGKCKSRPSGQSQQGSRAGRQIHLAPALAPAPLSAAYCTSPCSMHNWPLMTSSLSPPPTVPKAPHFNSKPSLSSSFIFPQFSKPFPQFSHPSQAILSHSHEVLGWLQPRCPTPSGTGMLLLASLMPLL